MIKILSLAIVLLISCKTTQNEYVGLTIAKSKVNSFPQFVASGTAKYTIEMKDEYITGTSVSGRTFGFKTSGSSQPLLSTKVLANASKSFSSLISSDGILNDTDIAAAAINAIDSVKADSIYITDIKQEKSGIPFLAESRKYMVRGKPMFLKSLGTTIPGIDQKLVLEKNAESDLLDEELNLLKIQYEKMYGTKLNLKSQNSKEMLQTIADEEPTKQPAKKK